MQMNDQVRASSYRWTFGNAEFDETRWELAVAGRPVDLERKPLELLGQLLRHAGEVLTKDELLESIWTGRIVVEAALTNAVGKLRKALGDESQTLIVTVPRVGYRLEGPVLRKSVPTPPPDSVLAVGDAVPRRPNYRLSERLARNEDSEIWRAEQPKTREVRVFKFSLCGTRLPALKREITLSRLLREALGERPEYVRMLDWDFDAPPYFVESEYGGPPLDQWLAEGGAGLDRGERLEFMAQLADAVAAAHEVGVLHKDLKPANVLVHGAPGAWRPRLTDFGSGRVLDASRLEALGITQLGLTRTQTLSSDSGSGTPLYLAPEVIAGQSPSIKSDLYALGVMLYQLLVGDFRRPLSPGWEADIDDPLLRSDIADFANGDPAKRPASARDMAERLRNLEPRRVRLDLEQSVQDRMVRSERLLAISRARRPWMVAASILLMAGLAVSLFYAQRAHRFGQRELLASMDARRALAGQDALNRFLIADVIEAGDPDRNAGKTLTVKEALLKARDKVDARFGHDPSTEGSVRLALAKAFDALAMTEEATHQYGLAEAAFLRAGSADARVAEARAGQVRKLLDLGRIHDADTLATRMEKELAIQSKASNVARAFTHQSRSDVQLHRGNVGKAAMETEKAIALLSSETSLSEMRLRLSVERGDMLFHQRRPLEAIAYLQPVLKEAEAKGYAGSRVVLRARAGLFQALISSGRLLEAREQLKRYESQVESIYGMKSLRGGAVHQLRGDLLFASGQYEAAAKSYANAIETYDYVLGKGNPYAAQNIPQVAESLRFAGHPAQAIAIMSPYMTPKMRSQGSPAARDSNLLYAWMLAHLDLNQADVVTPLVSAIERNADSQDGEELQAITTLIRVRAALSANRMERARQLVHDVATLHVEDPMFKPYLDALRRIGATLDKAAKGEPAEADGTFTAAGPRVRWR